MCESDVLFKLCPLSDEVRAMYHKVHGSYHEGDSGLDLFIAEDQTVKAGETAQLKLQLKASAWVMPYANTQQTSTDSTTRVNKSFMVMARSSIYKTPLRLCNAVGLVDAGYRGELMIVVDNVKTYDYTAKKGDRLVQAVGFTGGGVSFELVDKLDDTERGEAGFGSTTTTAEKRPMKDMTDVAADSKRVESATDENTATAATDV